jgi:hypothetical protein
MGSDNYEVSTDDVNFLASVSVPYTSATLDATPIYVRLKSGLTLGNYNNENITNSGGGASTANVICNGSVVLPEPTNHATSFLAGTPTANTIPLTWTDATGGIVPTGYLVKVSSVSYDAITPPVDLNPESDAMFVKNVAAGVGTVTFTDLQPNTTHYFKYGPIQIQVFISTINSMVPFPNNQRQRFHCISDQLFQVTGIVQPPGKFQVTTQHGIQLLQRYRYTKPQMSPFVTGMRSRFL